jgi:hypothetical protein
MPRHKKNNRSKKGGNPFHHANAQGTGATENWTINDLQVIQLPQTANAGFYTVRIAMDLNGYSITVSENGSAIWTFPSGFFNYNYPYGYGNN